MGIRFECIHCGHTLHVKDYLAGKRGICPHCQGKIDIPHSSTIIASGDEPSGIAVELKSALDEQPTREMCPQDVVNHQAAEMAVGPTVSANATDTVAGQRVPQAAGGVVGDPIAEAPQLQWYVLPPGSMTKYGPAQGEMMRAWLEEGRVAADALVWREGWPQWRGAASVFPRLGQAAGPAPSAHSAAAAPTNSAPVNTVPVVSVPLADGPITDDAAVVPYATGTGAESVVLGEDDAQPLPSRAATRHKPPRKCANSAT